MNLQILIFFISLICSGVTFFIFKRKTWLIAQYVFCSYVVFLVTVMIMEIKESYYHITKDFLLFYYITLVTIHFIWKYLKEKKGLDISEALKRGDKK